MNALVEFEKHKAAISSDIADALRSLGEAGVEAYASVELHHRTLSIFVPAIQQEGLDPTNTRAVPDPEDIKFAEALFEQKNHSDLSIRRRFDRYIKGTPDDRPPGLFFSAVPQDQERGQLDSYGIPERIQILGTEMGFVMLKDTYTPAERDRARTIFGKYRDLVHGDPDSHVATIRANPFSSNIINYRLSRLPALLGIKAQDDILSGLRMLDIGTWGGLYIPGSVPAEDLDILDTRLPIPSIFDEATLNPDNSRFF